MKKRVEELIRYGLSGCITTGVNFLLFVLFNRLGMFYILSNTISYLIAASLNYYLNLRYVFNREGSKGSGSCRQFFHFMLVRGASLLADNALFYILVSLLGVNVYAGRIGLSAVVIAVTYMVNRMVIF